MKRLITLFFLLIVVVFVYGCAGMSGMSRRPVYPTKLNAEMESQFNMAEEGLRSGNLGDAKRLYQNYIAAFGYNQLTDKARFKLGEIAFQNKNYGEALTYYREAYRNLYNPEIAPDAQYKAALALTKLDRPVEAYETLEEMEHKDVMPKLGIRADSLAIKMGRKINRGRDNLIKWYLFLLDDYSQLSGKDFVGIKKDTIVAQAEAKRVVGEWIRDSKVDAASVESLPIDGMKGKTSEGYVLYKLALIHFSHGDVDDAIKYLKKFKRGYPKHEYAQSGLRLLAELKGKENSKKYKIGVLLPLSGRFSLYGSSTLHGIQCAAGLTPPCTSPLNIELVIKDTTGDPVQAASRVEELAKEGVVGIVGPLMSATVTTAAKKAEELQIPMVSLSQKEGITSVGNYVFKHSLTSRDQVDTLVEFAKKERGIKKFGVLYPENRYGTYLADLYKEAVGRFGGKIIYSKGYQHEDLKGSSSVKEMGSVSNFEGGGVVEGMDKKFSVPSAVEALFIPDSYKAVRYVVVAVHNDSNKLQPNILFMGVNRWNNPGLVSHDLGLLEGSIFVDGFYKKSADASTRHFVQGFMTAFGMEPTILEAQAYDAARIIMAGIMEADSSNRDRVRAKMADLKNINGVSGNIRIDESGESRRRLFILTVRNGMIAELASAKGILHAGDKFPYSEPARLNSDAKYEGRRMPDLTVRTDSDKYDSIDFYTTEIEKAPIRNP